MKRLVFLLAAVLVLAVSREGLADTVASAKLVLIVANNGGTALGRADLHYADDDGAKYRALFRTLASRPADVLLLARFDRDSERLFADKPDAAPTRAELERNARVLESRAAELRAAGQAYEFLFVYAGHGDIDRGKGFVELEDGAFTADDLSALVKRIAAPRAHVILDSCNSLFMVSPRKPGGRHVATSEDAVRSIRERLPNVGVLVSTSSDGEVFEWSELGAGIFSHVVRSGLAGAADANGDGEVSYRELRAFVDVATQDVKNPRYRPKVFAYGPGGDDNIALFVPRSARGRKFTLSGPTRTSFRDGNDVPWIDAHIESGAEMTVVIPAAVEDGTQEILRVEGDRQTIVERKRIDGSVADRLASRGASAVFETLFVRPFGRNAMGAFVRRDSVEVSYGFSRDDVSRFSTLLQQVSDSDRSRRLINGGSAVVAGATAIGLGTALALRNETDTSREIGGTSIAVGIGTIAGSLVGLLRKSQGERLYADYQAALASGESEADAVAAADAKLEKVARRERTLRYVSLGLLAAATAGSLTGFIVNEAHPRPDEEFRVTFGFFSLLGAYGFALLTPSPVERLNDLWRADPARNNGQIRLAPVGAQGPGLSLSGTF